MRYLVCGALLLVPQIGLADDLYRPGNFAALASDRIARQIGDTLTVVVFELQRSDRVVAQISVEVRQVLPNGDLVVGGRQQMRINGERTQIDLEGRVRQADIASDNRVLSSRIASARIFFEGRGFLAGSAKPGIVSRIFRFLGLG